MNINNVDLSSFQSENFNMSNNLSNMSLEQIFKIKDTSSINEFSLYLAHFNIIPNVVSETGIDCRKAHRWFISNYGPEVKDTYYNKRYLNEWKVTELDDIFHFLSDDLMIYFDTNCDIVRLLYRNAKMENVNTLSDGIKKFKRRKSRAKPMMSLLIYTKMGIDIKPIEINRTKLNLTENYNDDFLSIHKTILKRLSTKNDKGLVLLHGAPGTGKTSYIRYLISILKKEVIFLPPNMASAITNPDLIGVLIDNPNSVFVIEDAENIVMDREHDGNSPVSALLNISDGLLADCLNIQIICSFNTDITKVDSALMRKGRLIAKYEFKELDLHKTKSLSKTLGFDAAIAKPMTLAAIYNQSEKDFQKKKNTDTIGFRISA